MRDMTGITLDGRHSGDSAGTQADQDNLRIEGLLHDLGHQMMTLSLLTDSVRTDSTMSPDSRQRTLVVLQEMFRAMDLIADVVPGDGPVASPGSCLVDVRHLADEVAQLASLAYGTTVTVRPGRAVRLRSDVRLIWRVLTNLVDNAVRAAGSAGQVTITVLAEPRAVIEIADNGPGFGLGPQGSAGLGMAVVRQLLEDADGTLEIADRPGGGACVRVVFGNQTSPDLKVQSPDLEVKTDICSDPL
jgi:signal transduction histidine kinase